MNLQARAVANSPAESPDTPYLPGLDGLRALSVLGVLVYHANAAWLPGGFLGVEVFFVISGFIITRGLAVDWLRDGRISVTGFWLRRARRLLPALFLLLAGVLAYAALFDDAGLAKLRQDVLFALAYVTNWRLIFGGESYFDSWNHPSYLRHLWSLAIEEQFYVLWPVVLAGALRVFKARLTWALVLLGAVASFSAMALWAARGDEGGATRAYYGTDARVGALLLGACVGFLPMAPRLQEWLSRSRLVGIAGVVALGQLLAFGVRMEATGSFIYEGGFFLVTLLAACLILTLNNPGSLASRLLSPRPLRWVGVRSYGIYLYHWPILLLTWPDTTGSTGLLLLQVGATLLLADLSYRFLELPVRKGALGRTYRALADGRAGWKQGFAAGFGFAAASMAVAFLAVSAMQAQRPETGVSTQVRFVTASVAQDVSSLSSTINPAPTITAEPLPADVAAAPPESEASIAEVCTVVRGRPYESNEEREWFLGHCLGQVQTRPPVNARPLPVFVATGTVTVEGGVSALGDSVMVGAGSLLAASFASIDIDAEVGRQVSQAIVLLRQRAAEGTLARNVVLHLGNNGVFTSGQFDQIMDAVGPERRVFFITLQVPRGWQDGNNAVIAQGVSRYGNAHVIDWHGVVEGHDELFGADGVHIAAAGARLYVGLVIDAVTR